MGKYGNSKIGYKINDDYYTPKYVFTELGIEFDLDVCAPEGGVSWIPAKQSFSLKDDGLGKEWFGNVWCNPPYSKPSDWMKKFIEHKNGIALIQISNSNWFNELWQKADGITFIYPKIKFEHKTDGTKVVFMPLVLVAFNQLNVNAISKFGRVR
jgi:hypothetical protein